MVSAAIENVAYLHDAMVHEFTIGVNAAGERCVRLRLLCDPDCGLEDWNDKIVEVEFRDPLVVLSEVFGHMVNMDTFNAWNAGCSGVMRERLERLTEIGISAPSHIVELVFHSGSITEVACDEICFSFPQDDQSD